jgi:hypothetical protein
MIEAINSSFRDPSGFIFKQNSEYFRAITPKAQENFDLFHSSGLYDELVSGGLILPHQEVPSEKLSDVYKVIRPEQLQWVSYPYEWSFGMLKRAALLTLDIQVRALKRGMSLKDASAYNVQFHKGKAVFIDTLSFEKLEPGKPWVAYKQFAQHFLAPLAVMYHNDLRLNQLMRVHIDGIPLEIASSMLPAKTKLSPTLMIHIHLHSKYQKKYSESATATKKKTPHLSMNGMMGILGQLSSYIQGLKLPEVETEWGDYYNFTNYKDESFQAKKRIIEGYRDRINPKTAWDLGANRGLFSRIFSDKGIPTIAWDIDPIAVDKNFNQIEKAGETSLLPLVVDLTNPSNSLGWANQERMSLEERGPVDVVMALALIHHISISNNVPFSKFAEYLSRLGNYLILEFVPKGDSQVDILLQTREDIFNQYDQKNFEKFFGEYFEILSKDDIVGSSRTLYLLKKKA